MLKKIVFFISLLGFSIGLVQANCIYNGIEYPEGTTVGPYECLNDKWVRK